MQTPSLTELCARLDTLHASLRGLGNAWTAIRDLFPGEQADAADQPDEAGALPESAYWRPLAQCLLKLGGSAQASSAIEEVGDYLATKLTSVDRAPLPGTGQVRWIVKVRFSRLRLKLYGLILADGRDGTWTLTDAGKRWASDPTKAFPAKPIPQDDPRQLALFMV